MKIIKKTDEPCLFYFRFDEGIFYSFLEEVCERRAKEGKTAKKNCFESYHCWAVALMVYFYYYNFLFTVFIIR